MTGPYPPHSDGTPPPAPPFPPSYPAQPYAPYAQPGSPYLAPPPGMPPFPVQAPPPRSRHGLVIGMFVGAVVLAIVCGAAIVGVVIYRNGHPSTTNSGGTATDDPLTNLIDYRTSNPSWLSRDHKTGEITYPMTPPAGGPHHAEWQNCMGDVYTSPIDNGNAVHSLEHGAVWITYQPGLAKDTVDELASRVRGKDYIMMSPYPGQTTPVSLQAWGYQLPMANVSWKQVDTFIARFRKTATVEPGAACSSGATTTSS